MAHISVLLQPSIDGLAFKKGDIFLDGTINGGGHSTEVARRFGKDVKIIGIDADHDALTKARVALEAQHADFVLEEENFRNLDKVLLKLEIPHVSKILLDLGLSSNQFEESGRGFTFQKDEPLKMTFKKNPTENDVTAEEIVNTWEENNIADIIYGYGEERYSRKIAKAIVDSRQVKPIKTTSDLVEILRKAVPGRYQHGKIHFATRTFQALRITANDEIRALEEGLKKGFEVLTTKGRMAVISFHSIEDRVVKNFFRDRARAGEAQLIHKKPIVPTILEVESNRRARSAKLRIIEKI